MGTIVTADPRVLAPKKPRKDRDWLDAWRGADHAAADAIAQTLTELSERVGITLANLSILKTGKARAIRFSTLYALCRELDCQPGDLIEWAVEE